MRVLIVMTAREVGGAELYVERLTRTLSSRCHFTIVLPTHPHVEALAQRLAGHTQVIRLAIEDQQRLPTAVREVRALARQADVVHLNSNHPGSRLGILFGFALTRSGTPLICVEHRVSQLDDIVVPGALRPFLPRLFRWSRRDAARVIAVSQQNAALLTSYYGLRAEQITVVLNGIDLPCFSESQIARARAVLRAELGLANQAILILTLARLAPNKGHRYLVEAIPEVLRAHPAGDGGIRHRERGEHQGVGRIPRALRRQPNLARLAGTDLGPGTGQSTVRGQDRAKLSRGSSGG